MGDVEHVPYLTLNIPQALYRLSKKGAEPEHFETVIDLLDFRADTTSDRIAVGFPSCLEDGQCLTWSYNELRKISKQYASRLQKVLQRENHIVALLAPSGPEFLAHTLACWRLGLAVLPIAIGTTPEGILALLQSTGASAIFAHATQQPQVQDVMERAKEKKVKIESFQWLAKDVDRSGEMVNGHRVAKGEDTLVIFHSSGSSGTPKPISHPHRFWSWSTSTAHGANAAAFTTTPLFHGGLSDLLRSFQAGSSLYCFSWHEGRAPTAQNILGSIRACPQTIRYFLSVPFILEMLTNDADGREMLKAMELVSTGGAPLPRQVGDTMVNEHNIKLVSRMGSSECGFLMSSWRDDFDHDKGWQWLRVSDDRTQEWLQFHRRDEDGLYELIVSRDWPMKLLSNTKDGAFSTNDLFERHATQSGWWKYVRRADDSIVMINGKKIASTPIEDALKAHQSISDALVFGADRPLLGAIIRCEQQTTKPALSELLKDVNRNLPTHGQLVEEMVVVVEADDPEAVFRNLPRSSKGTLQRGLALQQLAGLIDDTYARFEQGNAHSNEKRLTLHGNELVDWLTKKTSQIAGRSVDPVVDLYSAGVDSIMAARLRAAIHQYIELGGVKLTSNVVYEQQNLQALAGLIERREATTVTIEEEARRKLERFGDIEKLDFAKPESDPDCKATVLLTGATGALGSRILQALLASEQVSTIICLVRAVTKVEAKERLRNILSSRTIDHAVDLTSVRVVTTMEDAELQLLHQARQAVVIHCAWIVNFALPLKSFEEDCLAALHALIKLYAKCKHPSHLVFCSSLAAVQGANGRIQEEHYSDNISDAGSTGYGQSKWVAERLCRMIDGRAGLSIARVGQLCGDTRAGHWNETEAWPLLVRTAKEVGALPAVGPPIDWLPVDLAAKAIVDITLTPPRSSIVHIALPPSLDRPSWADFIGWLASSSLGTFDVLANEQWLAKVEAAGERVKGRALLPIWSSMSRSDQKVFDTKKAERQSHTMQAMQTVDEALCHKFVLTWKASGFL